MLSLVAVMRTPFLLATSLFLSAFSLAAETFYVDGANGSDSNSGASEGQAWASIQQAA